MSNLTPTRAGGDNLNSLFEVALEIAQREQRLMEELRTALEAGDNERALALARKLTGLSE